MRAAWVRKRSSCLPILATRTRRTVSSRPPPTPSVDWTCWIANAGFPVAKSFEELERPDLDACYNVMMGGFFHLSTAALPYLERTEHGRIVAVSTLNAHV